MALQYGGIYELLNVIFPLICIGFVSIEEKSEIVHIQSSYVIREDGTCGGHVKLFFVSRRRKKIDFVFA